MAQGNQEMALVVLLVIKLCCLLKLASAERLKCSSPLGVESKAISSIQALSSLTDHGPSHASLYGEKAWCAERNNNLQYIEVNFGRVKIVAGVATKGHGTEKNWTASYGLKYSFDGNTWFDYTKRYGQEKKVFQGNTNNDVIVMNNLDDHLVTQYLRINPQTWSSSICLRLEIYGCIADCDTYMGMAYEKATPAIPDSALVSSSQYNNLTTFNAQQARLFKSPNQPPVGKGAWLPFSNNENEYLQVDLGRVTQVSGIVTMGRSYDGHYVKEYYISYSNDGAQWSKVTQSGRPKIFPGNINSRATVAINKLNPPLYARYIRLRPRDWYGFIALRAEIIGCREAGHRDFGMTRNEIPDNYITASSYYSGILRPEFARLGLDMFGGAWICSIPNNTLDQYLQVHFGLNALPVTAIATQGRHDANQYPTFFKLQFSNDTATAAWRVYTENKEEKLFSRGTDRQLVERVDLAEVVVAKYIRFRPKSWFNWAAFRVEIYGFKGSLPQIFGQSPSNITLYEYQDVTLRCQAVGLGDITVTWYKENTLLQTRASNDNTDLLIVNLKASNAGGYRCKAANTHGTNSYSLHLSVHKSKDPYVMCMSPIILDDLTRTPDNTKVVSAKDETIIRPEKWYAFIAGPANEIPTACVKSGQCGGTAPGWLEHATPSVTDGVVDTKICFNSVTNCCGASTNVLVRRCQGYIVYKFYNGIPSSIDARICVTTNTKPRGTIPRIITLANGYALDGFLEASHVDVSSTMKCVALCMNSNGCLSFNYSRKENICELNGSTKSTQLHSTAFRRRSGFCYFEKVVPG